MSRDGSTSLALSRPCNHVFSGKTDAVQAKSGKTLSVRLSAEERDLLERQAGSKPLSAYVRSRLLEDKTAKRRAQLAPKPDARTISMLLAMLGSSGLSSHLARLAEAAEHSTLDLSPEDEKQLRDACALADHLLNTQDNEHVEVHELRGFVSDNVHGALHEAYAVSRGTKCKQFLFSLCLNPPPEENVPVAVFEDAIERIEKKVKLEGQPRVVMLHEKQGRRHAHCVWSRIDAREMKAVNMNHFKAKLMDVARELYLDHGWTMPKGLIDREQRNPLNYSREELQQAKRQKDDPKTIKLTLKECWATSDGKRAFAAALEHKGYYLAKGDRRGFVAVDWRGAIYSLSRWLGVKPKALKARLGDPAKLPSVADTTAKIDQKRKARLEELSSQVNKEYAAQGALLTQKRKLMTQSHRQAREELKQKQDEQRRQGQRIRQQRFRKGVLGLWDRISGRRKRTIARNEKEAIATRERERAEKHALVRQQLAQRQTVLQMQTRLKSRQEQDLKRLRTHFFEDRPTSEITRTFNRTATQSQKPAHGPGLSM